MSEQLIKDLATAFDVGEAEVRHLVVTAHRRYKTYPVPKRSSQGNRIIAQPAREIKILQRWAVQQYLQPLQVHPAAKAYEVGCSIKKNADVHTKSNFLLKMDFQSFFPSIKMGDFMHFADNSSRLTLDRDSLILLGLLFFWQPKGHRDLVMSIGAPSSPRLSNRMMYDIDSNIDDLCNEKGVRYTRYADDLSFSTDEPNVLSDVKKGVVKIIQSKTSPSLVINDDKTVWTSRKHLRMVTGVTLTHDRKLSIGRNRKRKIRAALHHFTFGGLSEKEILKIKGELAFASDVEPEFVGRMKARYGEGVIRSLQQYQSEDVQN